ncbi:MAG: transposase, partial [Planctomycetaceae bacterium]|nr:transposase [Planctomycetaceae bacterium]
MPRRPRICPAGMCFHVLNRAVARLTLFEKPEDYEAFERVLEEAVARVPLPVLSYLVMPNHWHFVVRPQTDSELSEFFRWLTHTHTMRWHAHYHTEGTGHLYQGRFKTFPVEDYVHLLVVIRYVERNALRANLVRKAEDWKYSSLWRRMNAKGTETSILSDWPVARPRQWRALINKP